MIKPMRWHGISMIYHHEHSRHNETKGKRTPFLTHLHLVPHMCVSESGQHWFRWWRVAYSAPSHYLSQCWVFVSLTVRNKLQWNFDQNTKLFIHENASENTVCEKAAILSRGRRANTFRETKFQHIWTHLLTHYLFRMCIKCQSGQKVLYNVS